MSNGRLAHRFSYELIVGPIPPGLTLDHLCRTPLCVNPRHLEPVSLRENILRGFSPMAINARKTRCAAGHELSGDNLYICPRGWRNCRACKRAMRSSPEGRERNNAQQRARRRMAAGMCESGINGTPRPEEMPPVPAVSV